MLGWKLRRMEVSLWMLSAFLTLKTFLSNLKLECCYIHVSARGGDLSLARLAPRPFFVIQKFTMLQRFTISDHWGIKKSYTCIIQQKTNTNHFEDKNDGFI